MQKKHWIYVVLTVFYGVLSISFVCPNQNNFYSTLPVENGAVSTVALFNTWTLWWNAEQATHGFEEYWEAPIFAPETDTFAFSEPQPFTVLLTPIAWVTQSPIFTYKFYLILSLTLNGLITAILLHRRVPFWIASIGGVWMLWLPAVSMNIGVIQLVPLWTLLWTWDAIARMSRTPVWYRGVETGLAFTAVWTTCMHHGLFLSLLLASTGLVLVQTWRKPKFYQAACIALIVGATFVGPLVYKVHSVMKQHDFSRNNTTASRLSAHPIQYTYTFSHNPIAFRKSPHTARQLSPGWAKLLLSCCCLVGLLWRKKWRRWLLFLAATGCVAFLFSLGPNLKLAAFTPWNILVEWIPGFAQVRSVYRFCYFVQMVVVLLGAYGLLQLRVLRRRYCHSKSAKRIATGLIFALACCATIESFPVRPTQAGVPDETIHEEWLGFIRERTTEDHCVACVPFAAGPLVEDFDSTVRWMYLGMFHHQPMVNGYSGFFPDSYNSLQKLVNKEFPSQKILKRFYDAKVQYVIVQSKIIPEEKVISANDEQLSLRRVFSDPVGIDVYELIYH